ncbi:MAG: hypothetical protein WC011_03750 [Candidatus Paceibacterota bacterium]
MTWALKRQILYILGLLIFFGAIALYFLWPYINKPPTCFDGKQNGTELGVDCGGGCVRACSFEVDKLSIFWSRSFEVVPGRYNAVSYIENQNPNKIIRKIKYRFRFADKDNLYIGQREGETFVPPAGKFAVFEPAINLGNSIPVYTTFEFTEAPLWENVDPSVVDQLNLVVYDINLTNEDSTPKLSAVIRNDSLFVIPDLNAVAILYDDLNNALSVSSTYVPVLNRESRVDVNFTWRAPMSKKVLTKEIIPMFNIQNIRLK